MIDGQELALLDALHAAERQQGDAWRDVELWREAAAHAPEGSGRRHEAVGELYAASVRLQAADELVEVAQAALRAYRDAAPPSEAQIGPWDVLASLPTDEADEQATEEVRYATRPGKARPTPRREALSGPVRGDNHRRAPAVLSPVRGGWGGYPGPGTGRPPATPCKRRKERGMDWQRVLYRLGWLALALLLAYALWLGVDTLRLDLALP